MGNNLQLMHDFSNHSYQTRVPDITAMSFSIDPISTLKNSILPIIFKIYH